MPEFQKISLSDDLLKRIILKIKREEEKRREKKHFFFFLFLIFLSLTFLPFSWQMFLNKIKDSGFFYFLLTAMDNYDLFLSLWQNFLWVFLETFPLWETLFLLINLVIFSLLFRFSRLSKKIISGNFLRKIKFV
ncbi:MAG: hypothetical protein ACPLZH_01720 [Minisyncoccales bacterium]